MGDWISLDAAATNPLFDQLRTQIIDGVRVGRLEPGSRLRFDLGTAAAANAYVAAARSLGLDRAAAVRYVEAAFG